MLGAMAVLLVTLACAVCAGDPHYAFDDYSNLLPLPNHHTNGTTLLVPPPDNRSLIYEALSVLGILNCYMNS